MTRSPIAPVLVLALALIGAAGYLGPQVKSREVVTASFWARKLRAPPSLTSWWWGTPAPTVA